MPNQFEVLSDEHKIQVANHTEGHKWIFERNHSYEGPEISIGIVDNLVYSTKRAAISSDKFEDATLQDVPNEVFDFLDEKEYHTEFA